MSMLPAFIIYLVNGYKETPKHSLKYYESLMGFFNESDVVRESYIDMTIAFSVVFGILIAIRTGVQISQLYNSNKEESKAMIISLGIANMISIFVWYVSMNLIADGNYGIVASGVLALFVVIGYIILLISEAQSYDNHKGSFGIRDTLEDYFYSSNSYREKKNKLINNYKKIITQ